MDYTLTVQLQEYLDANEKVLWTGQPKTGILFRATDVFLIPFSLLWSGFSFFWFTTAITSGAPLFFAMFGLPFVFIGLILVFGRFFLDAKVRARTVYGLTDNRILIKSGLFKNTLKSVSINTLTEIEIDEKADGTGTIYLGPKNPMSIWGSGMSWWPGVEVTPTIDLIENVRQVHNKILEIQKKKLN